MFRELVNTNTLQDWTYALIAAGSFIAVLHVLRRIVLHRLARIAKQTD
ncbi:MAG: mechanosensitive ion channel family protein, partial [Betaproteobacteria bacterium]|nr:mechanosensitive ion channel family protein [Betaproteobacteria bacterium]